MGVRPRGDESMVLLPRELEGEEFPQCPEAMHAKEASRERD